MKIDIGQSLGGGVMRSFEMSNYTISEVDTTGTGRLQADKQSDGRYWETAIVQGGKFYILNGKHLDKYATMNSFDECIKYFRANSHIKSSWSD